MPRVVIEHEPWCERDRHEVIEAGDTVDDQRVDVCVASPISVGGEFGYVDLRCASDNGLALVTIDLGGIRGASVEVAVQHAQVFADRLEEHAKELAEAIREAGRAYKAVPTAEVAPREGAAV